MDVQVQELIDKIKRDGIESASVSASKLVADAQTEARRIVEQARKDADALIVKGTLDVERTEKASIAAIEQASRNLVLSFRGEIEKLLASVVLSETASAYSDNLLKDVLPELLKAWASKEGDSLDLLLPQKSLAALEAHFKGSLSNALTKGVELKADKTLSGGFRIASRDGSAYYDFSAEAVASLLSAYLNPRLQETLKSSIKGI